MEAINNQQQHNRELKKFRNFNGVVFLAAKLLASSVFLFVVLFFHSSIIPVMFSFMQIFSDNIIISKNYMFLLCNGILVLIVNIPGSCDHETNYDKVKIRDFDHQEKAEEITNDASEVKQVEEEKETLDLINKEENNVVLINQDLESDDHVVSITQVLESDHDHGSDNYDIVCIDEFEDHEDEETTELLSVEGLNMKCEEFIRKMRQVIAYEQQNSLFLQHCSE